MCGSVGHGLLGRCAVQIYDAGRFTRSFIRFTISGGQTDESAYFYYRRYIAGMKDSVVGDQVKVEIRRAYAYEQQINLLNKAQAVGGCMP